VLEWHNRWALQPSSNGTAQTSVRKEVAMLDSRRALSLQFTSEGSALSSAVLIPLFMLVVLVMS
jgi:hypothetical protein